MIRAALVTAAGGAITGGAITGGVLYAALGIVLRHVDDARWAA